MAAYKRIVLYGNSVVIGGVGASLERVPQFDVLHLPSHSAGLSELEAIAPDVIVFDVESGHAAPAFSLLETRPGLLLLGVSPDGDVVGLWSRRQYRALSSRDLAALIEEVSQTSDPQECPTSAPERARDVWHAATGTVPSGMNTRQSKARGEVRNKTSRE